MGRRSSRFCRVTAPIGSKPPRWAGCAPRSRRLRVFYPTVPDLGDLYVKVHSKLVVVDDGFLRIGSSSFSNRSLGVDTECDLAIEAEGEARIERAIAAFRSRLLAEHLGCAPERVSQALARR